MTNRSSGKAIALAHMIRLLMDGEYTRMQLSEATGLHPHTISTYIKWLHKKRVVYITDWTRNVVNSIAAPVFTLNVDGCSDAPKPANKSRKEIDRDYRERQKQKQLIHMVAGNG